MKILWYTAMSMDGRLADAHDSLEYLDLIGSGAGADADADAEGDSEFDDFISDVDGILIGATTLRWLLRGGHGWPHGDVPTWLVSHDASLVEEVGETEAPFTRAEGDIGAIVDEIRAAGCKRVWLCGGGDLAGQLLELDLVDEVIATIAPAALGAGPVLFDGRDGKPRRFRLLDAGPWGGDAARLHWVRDRKRDARDGDPHK